MMWKTKIHAQSSALPAIAAALALSSTPAWSQEVQPTTNDPAPTVSAPAPTIQSDPVTVDPIVAEPASPAPEATSTRTTAPAPKATATKKTTHVSPVRKPTVTHSAQATAPVAAAPVAAVAANPAPAAPAATPPPIVDARPRADAAPAPAAAKSPLPVDETTMMLGGGALALLALGAGAVAVTSRRRVGAEVWDEPTVEEPAVPATAPAAYEEQPAIVEPSAFNWGTAQTAEPQVEARSGESWVERAHRGPTPDNPSLSLRKRLKRAAFFDAREQRIAAGQAEPVPSDAGLPESAAEARELELA